MQSVIPINHQSNAVPANGVFYIPIAQYVPAFATIVPIESVHGIPGDIAAILQGAHSMSIRQHVKLLPKSCCSCPPCPKQENTYSVYAGLNQDATNEFLRVDEVSDDWNRCCCAPYHPLKLEVRQFIPPPGTAMGATSDWAHLKGDVANDFNGFSALNKSNTLKEQYAMYPPLFTMVRDDGMRCCLKCPCKCLNTFVCCSFCQDGMKIYAGSVGNAPDVEAGRPVHTSNALLGSVLQPIFGGWIRPTLHLFSGSGEAASLPYAKIQGPCFFGGWSEMCCSFKFFTSFFNSPDKTGDVAIITKQRPKSLAGAAIELFSNNADNYSIEYNPNAQLSMAQKTTVLAGQLLADYMFFDGNTEKCKSDDSGITCYCCYFNCIGALFPIYLYIPKSSG